MNSNTFSRWQTVPTSAGPQKLVVTQWPVITVPYVHLPSSGGEGHLHQNTVPNCCYSHFVLFRKPDLNEEPGFAHFMLISQHYQELPCMDMQLAGLISLNNFLVPCKYLLFSTLTYCKCWKKYLILSRWLFKGWNPLPCRGLWPFYILWAQNLFLNYQNTKFLFSCPVYKISV